MRIVDSHNLCSPKEMRGKLAQVDARSNLILRCVPTWSRQVGAPMRESLQGGGLPGSGGIESRPALCRRRKNRIAVFQSESLVSALGFCRLLAACPAFSLRPAS